MKENAIHGAVGSGGGFRWRRGGGEEGKYVAVTRLDDVTLCLPCHHLTERD